MKETLNKSVKLADGLMQMHFTVKLTAQAISSQAAQEVKFTETGSRSLASGLKTLGSSDSFSQASAQTTTSELTDATALDKAASP